MQLSELKSKSLIYYKDRTDLSTYIQDGVDFATDYFNMKLRVREMVATATLTPDANGVCTLPDDFIEAITVTEDTAFAQPVSQITHIGQGTTYYANNAGLAKSYLISNGTITFYPISSNDMILVYYQKIPALVDVDMESNWLLEKYPLAYLDACRMFAADIADDDSGSETKYAGKVDNWIDELNARHQTSLYGRVTTDLSDELVVP